MGLSWRRDPRRSMVAAPWHCAVTVRLTATRAGRRVAAQSILPEADLAHGTGAHGWGAAAERVSVAVGEAGVAGQPDRAAPERPADLPRHRRLRGQRDPTDRERHPQRPG